MDRREIIQRVIDRIDGQRYLEIGIFDGKNFFQIRSKKKFAVDPNFIFSRISRFLWCLKNTSNFFATYYQVTSDKFFSETSQSDLFDVVFIDGLHTYEQALRDSVNALDRLNDSGILLLHDCSPPHEAAALPASSIDAARSANVPGWTDEWCGDVWKTICHLRSQRSDLQVFVLDCDYGVGVVRRGKPESPLDLEIDELNKMTYKDLEDNRKNLLNLKGKEFFSHFLTTL